MDNELFELMTKMYGEMQEGFKQVNSRIDGVENEVNEIKKDVSGLKEGQNKIEKELKEFRKETNENFNILEDNLIEMEGINASNHVIINTKLNRVSSNLDFLSHKEFQTEREMYHIKQKLHKQRRNTK